MSSPYRGLQDYQFWRRAVSTVEPHRFDPVVSPRIAIPPEARVATAGSCFAQHISRRLSEIGFNYFVTEPGLELDAAERQTRNYGVFSARFGNVYTTAQLLQLFQEAFEGRAALETSWRRPDGRYADPLRPNIEPDGFESPEAVAAARREHIEAVRRMFLECDVFIFTLGLTEAWTSTEDGTVFPLAPGVVAGEYDPARYAPLNLTVAEVEQQLNQFCLALKQVNPGVKVVLTVSPVPLIATFEDRNVVCSTVYSKSVLRVAAETTVRTHDWVDYFPSFEIITSSNNGGRYFGPDYRDVNHLGVAHAMRCFLRNYVQGGTNGGPGTAAIAALVASESTPGVVCDEETIVMARG